MKLAICAVVAVAALFSGPSAAAAAKVSTFYSPHWAGYAQVGTGKNKPFVFVAGEWTVPTVKTGRGDQYASDWVGLGGWHAENNELLQAGIEENNHDGTAQYYAWTEVLPQPSKRAPLTIQAGDQIIVIISEGAGHYWDLYMQVALDHKTQVYNRYVTWTIPAYYVEAIHEAPTASSGGQLPLAQTANVDFSAVSVSTNMTGQPESIGAHFPGATLTRVFMGSSPKNVIASPSVLGDACFLVADGSKPPPANC